MSADGEVDRLRAGIQWVRGMCSDGAPLEVIDAKLGEILHGVAGVCVECGETFTKSRVNQRFCCKKHRLLWNGRRTSATYYAKKTGQVAA